MQSERGKKIDERGGGFGGIEEREVARNRGRGRRKGRGLARNVLHRHEKARVWKTEGPVNQIELSRDQKAKKKNATNISSKAKMDVLVIVGQLKIISLFFSDHFYEITFVGSDTAEPSYATTSDSTKHKREEPETTSKCC